METSMMSFPSRSIVVAGRGTPLVMLQRKPRSASIESDDDGTFDAVVPPEGIVLEQVLVGRDKRKSNVSSTARPTADPDGMDGGVVWRRGAVDGRPGKVDGSVAALEMDQWKMVAATFESVATAVHVAGQQEGFLSIDCGLDARFSGRKDTYTNIAYISDSPYVDGGENHRVAADQESSTNDVSLLTLRSFPSGLRNCYTLPTESGAKYLVRMEFFHGRYDGKSSPLSLQFDLHLGTNYWDTVTLQDTTDDWWSEAIFVAWSSWVPVCLLNTGTGTPFVNTVELRPLGASLYPDVTIDESISMYRRANMGGNFTL
uniref:Malectin-like domain-containing protein n=1 Tax=Aegilops tauschii TaxID=37682 RepID=M8C0S1_AEGTA